MKNVIATIAMALVGFSAQASLVENYYADLNQFQIQPGTYLEKQLEGKDFTANIAITPITDITLSIFPVFKCPQGLFCPAVAIAYEPITFTVPMHKRFIGHCGEMIFTGRVDQRPVDGVMTDITVIDNTTNTCKTFVMLPATQVIVQRQSLLQANPERHVFSGNEAFHQLM